MQVHIYSFSYAFTGIPPDQWGNGGGFVFDCRLLPNPMYVDTLAPFTGMDDCVKEYMAEQAPVGYFLASVARLVDAAVEEYPRRGYEHLTVCFGCTGGQHRSVYCAEWMSERLKEKGCEVTLQHVALEASGAVEKHGV